jgi:hypothetical protein
MEKLLTAFVIIGGMLFVVCVWVVFVSRIVKQHKKEKEKSRNGAQRLNDALGRELDEMKGE